MPRQRNTKTEGAILTEADLAYIAGFLDGEGSIMISRRPETVDRGPRYQVRVQVGNTNEPVIRWLRDTFGGCLAVREAGKYEGKDRLRKRTLYHWLLSCKLAVDFLRLVLPYLRVKRAQALLAIEFQDRFIPKSNGHWARLTPDRLAEMEAERLRLQGMNAGSSCNH